MKTDNSNGLKTSLEVFNSCPLSILKSTCNFDHDMAKFIYLI